MDLFSYYDRKESALQISSKNLINEIIHTLRTIAQVARYLSIVDGKAVAHISWANGIVK